ncbi:MipA/OmpV family protein, partial [Moraxella catarrhalis]|uniref:MipA/OmpV family protein n=1 Tax=Moraxella catarrhalis TaxID=480 RepID=UPI0013D18F7C
DTAYQADSGWSPTNHTAYQADSGWSPFVTATVNYQVTPKVSAFVNQRIEWLSNAQKNSPMTDNKIDSKTRLGLNYHF